MPAFLRACGWLLLALSTSCGTCLLEVTRPVTFTAPDGSAIPGEIAYREPEGFLFSDSPPIHAPLVGLLLEPVDWLMSTGIAVSAIFDREQDVAGGPLGWLASLTPFATLAPQMHLPPPMEIRIDAAQRIALYDESAGRRAGAIANAAGDHRILAATRTASGPETLACTLVLIRTGPRTDLPAEAQKQAFAGHFANMERLARAGELLVAGPFGKDKHAADLRGIFILDTADPARARELAGTDPAAQAGVFVLEYLSFTTTAPLRLHLARELAVLDAAVAAGRQPSPGAGIRAYVWAIAAVDDTRAVEVAADPRVLLTGRGGDGRTWLLLDAPDIAGARVVAQSLALGGDVTFDSWYSASGLARLRN